MPLAQAAVVAPEAAPFAVVRLLLKPGTWYEDQRDLFRPFNRLVAPDEAMRGEVVELTAARAGPRPPGLRAGEQQGRRLVAADHRGARRAARRRVEHR